MILHNKTLQFIISNNYIYGSFIKKQLFPMIIYLNILYGQKNYELFNIQHIEFIQNNRICEIAFQNYVTDFHIILQ